MSYYVCTQFGSLYFDLKQYVESYPKPIVKMNDSPKDIKIKSKQAQYLLSAEAVKTH